MSEQEQGHEMRITTHGKINSFVSFALDFLQKNPTKTLTLHTLPSTTTHPSSSPSTNEQGTQATKDSFTSVTSSIPRLVSTVEIIKREYLKIQDISTAENGAIHGLNQYNELGNLEDITDTVHVGPQREDEERERMNKIVAALKGKNHLQQKKIPYMKITLCRQEVARFKGKKISHQSPSIRRLSKSTKTRLKKRFQKQTAAVEGAGMETSQESEHMGEA
ncbi:hypothetical protein C8Q75DRAFT_747748 [Abortiporus biennis]|nr:hypothetical protein C8Q75DRAFT_747748 [Abortiporus biennis]